MACHANAYVGHDAGGQRHPELAARPAQPEIRRQLPLVHLAHVGSGAKPRLCAFTSGFTTQTATNDGTGAALASFLLGLPASRQVQNGVPTMDLRQWQASAFVQDTWRVGRRTTIDAGLRYEYMAPLADVSRQWSTLYPADGKLGAFIGAPASPSDQQRIAWSRSHTATPPVPDG